MSFDFYEERARRQHAMFLKDLAAHYANEHFMATRRQLKTGGQSSAIRIAYIPPAPFPRR